MSDFDTVSLGREATRLLRDPAFIAALAKAEQLITNEWMISDPRDAQQRELLHAELRGLRRFKGRLQAMEIDGKQVDDRRSLRA